MSAMTMYLRSCMLLTLSNIASSAKNVSSDTNAMTPTAVPYPQTPLDIRKLPKHFPLCHP